MTRTLLVILAALAGSLALAYELGGSVGAGVAAGCLGGASAAGLGAAWQQHVARARPADVMRAHVEAFLLLLGACLSGGLVFRFVARAAERVDWRSYLITFATAGFVVMMAGAFDNARALRAPRATGGGERP